MRGISTLRFVLLTRSWTQKRLAERTGIAEPTISLIAGGRLTPTIQQRDLICEALGLPEKEVFESAGA